MMSSFLYYFHQFHYKVDLSFWRDLTMGHPEVLELGCGTGRVTFALAEANRKVWGFDRDFQPVQFAQQRLTEMPLRVRERVTFFVMDMRSFHVEKSFDAVISPCNTYSLFSSKERGSILNQVKDHLHRGGLFVVSLPNPHQMRKVKEEGRKDPQAWDPVVEDSFSHPLTGNPVQVSSRLSPINGGLRWTWIYDQLLPDGRLTREEVSRDHKISSLRRYVTEYEKAGFSVSLYGDFQKSPYRQQSPYLILHGVKNR